MDNTKSDGVYRSTTEANPKRRRLRVGDPDFTPPDGGWGWFIVLACGFSNVREFLMQFPTLNTGTFI